jgi:hypothetical protein
LSVLRSISHWRRVHTAAPAHFLRSIVCQRRLLQRICSDLHAATVHCRGLAVLCAGCLLISSACWAATADPATATLLRTMVEQIADGRIISPPDDNAMQTWQRVLQRDIAMQHSPEVLRALEDFDTYARTRAAAEQAAGRGLVAAELTVFAEQASRITGRTSPAGPAGVIAAATASVASADAYQAPAVAAVTVAITPGPPSGTATTQASTPSATAAADPPASRSEPTEVAIGTGPPTQAAIGLASVTDIVMHITSRTQPFGATPGVADSERPAQSVSDAAAVPLTVRLTSGALPAAPAATSAAQPALAGTAAARQTAAPDPATAAFYAARGDAMLASKDISAARKFYEYAADAGSARAAVALARSYDPAFTTQLGPRADGELAASWYRRAEQLSQSGDSGK